MANAPNQAMNELGLPVGYAFKPEYEVTPRDAKAALEKGTLFLVDCRTQPEWECARVAGSVFIPLQDIEQRHDEVEPGPGQTVAVICHHGVRSVRAALALRALGHEGVMSVAGGIEAWSLSADPSIPRYERGPAGCRVV